MNEKQQKKTKRHDFEKIGWTIITEEGSNGCYINFKMYGISGEVFSEKGVVPKPEERLIYERTGATSGMDTVSNLDEAQIFMSGMLKWDGCSDVSFNEPSIHFCGLLGWKSFAKAVENLHQLAVELIPSADASLILE